MNAELIFGVLLAGLILALASYVILGRNRFATTVGFVAYGLVLSLGWMVLAAPDVALTEAALGSGVTGALLLAACHKLRNDHARPSGPFLKLIAMILCGVLTAALIAVVLNLPEPPPSLAETAMEPLKSTGLGNPVTATLMAYRALDTMLEKVVLLLSLVAVWSLAPDRCWGGRPAFGYAAERGGPLLFLARVLIPSGVVVGIYLFWVGADAPGGAFAGGAVISAMAILGFWAGVSQPPAVSSLSLRGILVIGIVVFLVVGYCGYLWNSSFLSYPEAFAKPIIVVIEVAMTASIAATLAMLVAGPPGTSLRR